MKKVNPLKVVKVLIEDEYKLKCADIIVEFKDVQCKAIINKYFLIFYYVDTFYISFSLNFCKGIDIAYFTQQLTLYLLSTLTPYIDHFVDMETGEITFGQEAFIKNDNLNTQNLGIKLCPVCDRYLPYELFKDSNGFCVLCNQTTLDSVTFH